MNGVLNIGTQDGLLTLCQREVEHRKQRFIPIQFDYADAAGISGKFQDQWKAAKKFYMGA